MPKKERWPRNTPHIKFHGAIEHDVTGTMHRYTTYVDQKPYRISLDAGVHQGAGVNPLDHKNTGLNSLPDIILMSHSHLDHCGNLPLLSKEGFKGKVLGTETTLKGIEITLKDSLTIMQKQTDPQYYRNKSKLKTELRYYWKFVKENEDHIKSNRYLYVPTINESIHDLIEKKGHIKGFGKGYHITADDGLDVRELCLKYISILKDHKIKSPADIDNLEVENKFIPYTKADIDNIISCFVPIETDKEILLKKGGDNTIGVTFVNAGHILGSTQIMIKDKLFGNTRFTGDLGRSRETLYLEAPVLPDSQYGKINTLITESTYGGKNHPPRSPEHYRMMEAVRNTKGNILAAAFSNNRHQDFQQFFTEKRDGKEYDKFASILLCDGYTSKKFTRIFDESAKDIYDNLNHRALQRADELPLEKGESALKKGKKTIVITSSGMMNGGAVEAYMHDILSDPNGLLIITGYQSEKSRGRQILDDGKYTLNGITHEVKCPIFKCESFSSHADHDELLKLVESAKPDLSYLVHGEMSSKRALESAILGEGLSKKVCIPIIKGLKHPLGNK